MVFVTANYKMSFDCLRSQLGGLDCWIMVLDTKGINVWCAAGKGTFGTEEMAKRIEDTGLGNVVSHRKLILPQLGAPGVSAHILRDRSGFSVIYGPVRAKDIPAFLKAGKKATPEMRRVEFGILDRAALIPCELVQSAKYILLLAAAFLLLSGLGPGIYSLDRVATYGITAVILLTAGYLAGMIIPLLLLPWIPGRAFSLKGFLVGAVLAAGIGLYLSGEPGSYPSRWWVVSWLFVIPALTSFIAMNFTGTSTYTSLSGVKKEMKVALPVQIATAAIGVCMWIAGLFV
jgi:acetyl-CoA decarbonylase/synthase complex subunit gamma